MGSISDLCACLACRQRQMINDMTENLVNTARSRDVSDILRLQAKRVPDKIALAFEGEADTFAALDAVVTRTANAIRASGIEPGDRVAILSHNNRAFVILRFAIIRAGAIFTPINFMLNADEVAYILEHCGARALLVEDTLCDLADKALGQLDTQPLLKAFICHDGVAVPPSWVAAEAWFDFPDETPLAQTRLEDDPVQIMYTSGTESRPKGALLSSRALMAQYVTCIVDGGMEANDVELHCLPLYHCAQLDCFLSVDLYLGATSYLHRSADPAKMLEAIERDRITKLFCPPTVWIALLRHPDFERRDLSTLVKGYYGASIMPVSIIEELTARLPNLRLWNFYGQTEMAPVATILKPEDQLSRLGSAGRPGLNVETIVVDDHDMPLPPGMMGEIVHRSPQAMLGYYNDPEKTRAAFANGWFHSGDLGRFDDDGYLYVVDRKKDMIKSGGENVASREVEEALFGHNQVNEVAVFGIPDPKWIEAVVAAVVPKDPSSFDLSLLMEHASAKLAPYKRPKQFFIVEGLPKNASGKVLKTELRRTLVGD
jgi:fatty-acyl-CoA synthase